LSFVVSLGYLGFLIGPILVGAASTVVGLPVALAIPALLALFVSLGAGALGRTNSLDNRRPVPS
jgi:hypothetical protein